MGGGGAPWGCAGKWRGLGREWKGGRVPRTWAERGAWTGVDHPGRDEVVAAMECDWRKVAAALTGPVPGGRAIWYQKHMAHHLLPEVDRGWIGELRNCFLIRDPARVIVSLSKVMAHPGL